MMPQRGRLIFLVAIGGLLLSFGSNPTACAQYSVANLSPPLRNESITLPMDPKDAKGFTIQFHWDAMLDPGYASLEIEVVSASVFAADRRLSIQMLPVDGGHAPPQNGLAIELPIPVDQGTKRQTFVRRIPKWSFGTGYQLRVYDDGNELKDYAGSIGKMLLRRSRRPPNNLLSRDTQLNVLIQRPVANTFPQLLAQSQTAISSFKLSELPGDWRGLQSQDLVVLDQATMLQLSDQDKAKYTAQHQALRDWLIMGGTIIVSQCDSMNTITDAMNVSHAPSQSRKLSTNPITAAQKAILDGTAKPPELAKFERAYRLLSESEKGIQRNTQSSFYDSELELEQYLAAESAAKAAAAMAPKGTGGTVVVQPVLSGQIIGVHRGTVINTHLWSQINSCLAHRQSPMLRRGVDPLLGDTRVKRCMIPGVSEPPVYTFIGLLTLFVILVGPVAYRLTSKSGRAYLMLAIAPTLALVTTVSLLAYAILSDGFGTQTRIRQVTWVDGKSGDAYERVRATYFAGIQPRDGIRFPANAEVMHYPNHDEGAWQKLNKRDHRVHASVVVDDDGQQFDSRILPSRTQQQFVMHHPRRNLGGLKTAQLDSRTLSVENSFAFELRKIVIRDHAGKYWMSDQLLGSQSNQKAIACRPQDAAKILGNMYTDNALMATPGSTGRSSYRYNNDMRDLISSVSQKSANSSMISDGFAEQWLQLHMQVLGELPKGSFAAISDVSDDVVWIEDAERKQSLRYVFGTLR